MKNLGISITLFNPIENTQEPHLWGVQAIIDPNLYDLEEDISPAQIKKMESSMLDFMFEFPGIEGPIEDDTRLEMFRKSLEKVLDIMSMVKMKPF